MQAFWAKANPFYCDGEGAESFAQFFERVKQAKTWLKQMDKGPVLLFGHGQFIRTLLFLLLTQKVEVDPKTMNYIGNFIQAFYVPNASVMKCWFLPQGEVHFSTVITSHLPKELQT